MLDAVDAEQEAEIAGLGLKTFVTDTIMADDAGRARVARAVLDFAAPPEPEQSGTDDEGAAGPDGDSVPSGA